VLIRIQLWLLVGFAGKLLLTGGERAILVEQQAESAEKPLDWQNGCEKWELIQTQSNLIQLVCQQDLNKAKRTNIIGTIGDSLICCHHYGQKRVTRIISPRKARNERKLYSEQNGFLMAPLFK